MVRDFAVDAVLMMMKQQLKGIFEVKRRMIVVVEKMWLVLDDNNHEVVNDTNLKFPKCENRVFFLVVIVTQQ